MIVAPDGRSDADIPVSGSVPTVAVITVDRELRVLHADGVAFDQRGFAVEDWPGRHLRELLPADAFDELEPRYRAALEGAPQSFEYRSQSATSVFSVQITPARASDGAIFSVVAVMQDMTSPTACG
jgi:PAS domain S-box-containing protein